MLPDLDIRSGGMASFGETVSSLVDAYTKCLAFLRVSRKTEHPDKLRKASAGSDQASTLQSALRKSRSKVRRTYTSKRSDGGAAFEKGDGESIYLVFTRSRWCQREV